ncbi:MAG: gluconokinase [Rubrobacteraceae bacterium]
MPAAGQRGEWGNVGVFIGVDIGTTSTKTIAFDPEGAILAEESVGYELRSPQPSRAEQDPDEILEAVLGSLAAVVQQVEETQNDKVSGVSFSAAMHSLLALDEEGNPLTPSITFADNRAAGQAARIREELDGPELHRRTGTPIHPMSPLAKLLWFREEDEETFEAAARWVSIKEYVFFRLFGEYVVDHSIASATGLFNLENLDWDEGALGVAGVSVDSLSRPVPTTHVVTGMNEELAGRLRLDVNTPFVAGANDGVLANLGLGAVAPGVVACSIGTSGAVRSVVHEPRVDDDRKLFCYALTEEQWVVGGPINNGGIAFQWALEKLFPGLGREAEDQGRDPNELAGEMVEDVPAGSGGLIFLPYLTGERAPYWNADVKGVFFGLTLQHERKHLIRAVMEGVIYQMYAVQLALEKTFGEPREIRATGGFANSPVWRQIMADVFQRGISFPESYESSCWGAALLGMKALGAIDSLDTANEMTRIPTTQEPNERSAAVYHELMEIFTRLYERLEPEFTEISKFQDSYMDDEKG